MNFPVSNSIMCSGGRSRDIGYKFVIKFFEPVGENWRFEFGTDFGYGYAIYYDGILYSVSNNDFWWGNSWNNADVFRIV